ncbi:MAG: hypothetical protein ABGY29_07230, partial [bacterium]
NEKMLYTTERQRVRGLIDGVIDENAGSKAEVAKVFGLSLPKGKAFAAESDDDESLSVLVGEDEGDQ